MRDKNVLMRNKISSCEIKKLSNEIKKGFSFFPLSLSYLLIDARKKFPHARQKYPGARQIIVLMRVKKSSYETKISSVVILFLVYVIGARQNG